MTHKPTVLASLLGVAIGGSAVAPEKPRKYNRHERRAFAAIQRRAARRAPASAK